MRNENFDTASPRLVIPETGQYLWDWYTNISDSITRVRDGQCFKIEPIQWAAWRSLTGHIVWPSDYAILQAMDSAYVAEMNKELKDFREREQYRLEQEAATRKPRK